MSNSNHSAKFINMLIALMASIAIALTCIVPTALAEDGDGTDDNNNGGSTVQPAGPVPNIIITNFTYGDGSVAVGTNFDLGFTFQNMGKVAVSNMVVTVDGGENFAISGGTKTSDGVTAMLYNSMEHYLPLLEAKRKAAVEQVVFAPVRDESNEENVENNE